MMNTSQRLAIELALFSKMTPQITLSQDTPEDTQDSIKMEDTTAQLSNGPTFPFLKQRLLTVKIL
jgi:hypothetical protein